ncbi:MAG: hypothetical protein AAFV31_18010 [Pseudomonadota bacterium]
MNKLPDDNFDDATALLGLGVDDMAKLRFLLQAVEIDSTGARLSLKVGQSRLTLHENGTIRLDGRALVQTADESITLDGAVIQLN